MEEKREGAVFDGVDLGLEDSGEVSRGLTMFCAGFVVCVRILNGRVF